MDLSMLAGGLLFLVLWPLLFAVLAVGLSRETRAQVWIGSSALTLAAVVHVMLLYSSPWVLLFTDSVGLTASASLSAGYFNALNPPPARFWELPIATIVVVAATALWCKVPDLKRSQ
jgi:hypothetical protein